MKQKNDFEKVAEYLQEPDFNRVLVVCHRSPDGDACGSAHALAYALRKMGKQARVFCPDPFGAEFSYLTSAEEGLSFFEPTHFVSVDVAAPDMLCGASFTDKIEIVIDHHRINGVQGKLRCIMPEMASCGEMVLEIIRLLPVSFDAYLADALYTAMATDTGCFRYSNTNAHTFSSVAFLYPFAAEKAFYRINKALFETKSKKRMQLEAYAAGEVRYFAQGKGSYLTVSLEKQRELQVGYDELDPLINVIRQIEGVRLSFVAKEREPGVFKVSVRAEEGFDASDFCHVFGGGGHISAAGCTLEGEESEILSRLLSEAEERLR